MVPQGQDWWRWWWLNHKLRLRKLNVWRSRLIFFDVMLWHLFPLLWGRCDEENCRNECLLHPLNLNYHAAHDRGQATGFGAQWSKQLSEGFFLYFLCILIKIFAIHILVTLYYWETRQYLINVKADGHMRVFYKSPFGPSMLVGNTGSVISVILGPDLDAFGRFFHFIRFRLRESV